ncbi:MAG: hypothetical protein QM775_14125 [Pirellulales bacterium]
MDAVATKPATDLTTGLIAGDETQAKAVWMAALLRQAADDLLGGAAPADAFEHLGGSFEEIIAANACPQINPTVFALSVHP